MSDRLSPGEKGPEDILQDLEDSYLPLVLSVAAILAMSDEEIDAELRRNGVDPDRPLDPRLIKMMKEGEADRREP